MGLGVGQLWDAIPIFAILCPLQHRCGGSSHLTQLFRELNSYRNQGGEHVSGPENISQVLFPFLSSFRSKSQPFLFLTVFYFVMDIESISKESLILLIGINLRNI